jgi:endonuclease/exonuclease/phosphatase family metal-dependent hydrolase
MRRAVCWLASLFLCLHAGAEEIVFAAYNVQNYLRMDRRVDNKSLKDAPKPESEIEAVVNVITKIKPDILGVVEMGDEAMLDDLQKRLKAAGLDLPHREWLQGADENRHVCLLSRFPIVDRKSRGDISFDMNGKTERFNRGILDVSVEVNPGYRLRLVGVHLKSRRTVEEYDEAWMRAKEAWFLRDHINGILAADPQTNLLLFGDFNDTKNNYPIKEVIGKKGTPNYMMDLWLRDSRNERWTHYWRTADEYARIDYIMVSPGMAKEVLFDKSGIDDSPFWNDASDHRAIYTTISAENK